MSPEHERLLALWRERWPQREAALVAFVVPHHSEALDADELRSWLAQALPSTSLPTRVVICDDLPRTSAGKVDRAALRLPAQASTSRRVPVAPRSAIERRLMALYAQVLGQAPTSVEDDFFAHLGGHSLLATQLASLIRQEWSIEFELRLIFDRPTVAGLAGGIEQALLVATASRQTHAAQPIRRRAQAIEVPAGTVSGTNP